MEAEWTRRQFLMQDMARLNSSTIPVTRSRITLGVHVKTVMRFTYFKSYEA